MKRFLALFLAISASAMMFVSCGDPADTTTASTTPAETTTEGTTTEGTTTAETTTERTTYTSLVEGVLDTYEHDYIIRHVANAETGEIVGVAVCYWEYDKVVKDIVFDEVFTYRNSVGEQFSYPVIQIGYGQGVIPFQSSIVETIDIPSTVKRIYNNSFGSCINLKKLTLNEGLEEIGAMAFWDARSLESVVIPSTVTTIGEYAFADCRNLKSVTIPRRFEDQVDIIFENCSKEIVFIYVD